MCYDAFKIVLDDDDPSPDDDDKVLTVEVFVVVLLCPQTVLDDQAIRPREVRNSCRIEVST